jgi:hypothetical protein
MTETRETNQPTAATNLQKAACQKFRLLPKACPVNDPSFHHLARDYISHDLQLSTLLREAKDILHLTYTPTVCFLNDSGKTVKDLSTLPKWSALVVSNWKPTDAKPPKTVLLVLNTIPRPTRGYPYFIRGDLKKLLEDATKLFQLETKKKRDEEEDPKETVSRPRDRTKEPKVARAAFTVDGDPVTDLDLLPDNSLLLISLTGTFQRDEEPARSVSASTSVQFESSPQDIFNYLVAFASDSVAHRTRVAELSVFCSLAPGQRETLPEYETMSRALRETRLGSLSSQLICDGIRPAGHDQIDLRLLSKSAELLDKADLNSFQFVITGGRNSGKTPFLYSFVTTLHRKMELCGEATSWLFFPLNFAKYQRFVGDWLHLYELFVDTTIAAASGSRLEFAQHARQVRKYLMALPEAQAKARDPTDAAKAQRIYERTPPKGFDALREYSRFFFQYDPMTSIASLPDLVARALGFETSLLVLDHFDCADRSLAAAIHKQFSKSRFVIASRNDKKFFSLFKMADVSFIYTESVLPFAAGEWEDAKVTISELRLVIGVKDCMGCPGYIGDFLKIVEALKSSRRVYKYSMVRAKGDVSRDFFIRSEFFRLCVRLDGAGSKLITKANLNRLGDHSESLTLSLIDAEPSKPRKPSAPPKASGERSVAGSMKSTEGSVRSTGWSQGSKARSRHDGDDGDDHEWAAEAPPEEAQGREKKTVSFAPYLGERPAAADEESGDQGPAKTAPVASEKVPELHVEEEEEVEDTIRDNLSMDTAKRQLAATVRDHGDLSDDHLAQERAVPNKGGAPLKRGDMDDDSFDFVDQNRAGKTTTPSAKKPSRDDDWDDSGPTHKQAIPNKGGAPLKRSDMDDDSSDFVDQNRAGKTTTPSAKKPVFRQDSHNGDYDSHPGKVAPAARKAPADYRDDARSPKKKVPRLDYYSDDWAPPKSGGTAGDFYEYSD